MHGIKLTKERFYSLAGMPIKEIYVLLAAEQGVAIDIDAVVADKKRLHAQAPLPATISPVEAIIRAHHGKVPLAVASSGCARRTARPTQPRRVSRLARRVSRVGRAARWPAHAVRSRIAPRALVSPDATPV